MEGVHRMPRATDQTAQVDSLYVYASAVTALIIIAPDSVHEQTKEAAGLESYKSRVCWLGSPLPSPPKGQTARCALPSPKMLALLSPKQFSCPPGNSSIRGLISPKFE